ncbi:MAG: AzlC family ABC transporter permease [Clostridia bacterium]|nr:AzlC family ABC transporter permease [Clostridia bacterium]
MKKYLKTAVIKTLPVMAGYMVLGIGFGIIAQKNGYGILWVLAMSALIYAGSMQYVAVSLLTGGASLLTSALTTLMVNARHLFYGISMIGPYKGAGKYKPYLIFALTDETYSLTCTGDYPEGADKHKYWFLLSLLDQTYWVTGSVLGAIAGKAIPFDSTGIDFAMTALFITVFVEQWKTTKNHIPALIGLGASVLCLLIFGRDSFLIPAMILILGMLSGGKKIIERKEGGA